NDEAASLDWSKSRSRTLSGHKVSNYYKDDVDHLLEAADVGHKLGGSNSFSTARTSSVAAAFRRYMSSSMGTSSEFQAGNESVQVDAVNDSFDNERADEKHKHVRDDESSEPDLMHAGIIHESLAPSLEITMIDEDDGDAPDGSMDSSIDESYSDKTLSGRHKKFLPARETNDSALTQTQIGDLMKNETEPDAYDAAKQTSMDFISGIRSEEPDPDNEAEGVSHESVREVKRGLISSLDADNLELQRIEEPVAAICARIQESIKLLRSELTPHAAASVLQTLSKIIRNIIDHPGEQKFRRIRKDNAHFQRNVANYKAAMEVLNTVGFMEDVVVDAVGVAEAYLVLKRNDPGLLWLAKSSLEVFIS
ncbi:LOW QUALITY PROTEIN: uncharacterized protein LOC110035207, partial [Phalaenopsis equestris]|uniref:LOW QUALITY PROTEIN: uncharacterized protein LOC110035207 n=1 Tax=Phalaenopsis equestris TaxID=78828 RepID=UPI0009E40B72